MRTLAPALALLVNLAGCEGEPVDTDVAVECESLTVDRYSDDCSIILEGCDDGHLHELLCHQYDNGDGTYDRRLICECAEDQAVYGTTILEGYKCGGIDTGPLTIEAGFRACGTELSVPDSE